MASQLNPAWQRKLTSSNHLAKISTHFLSDSPTPGRVADSCQVIPFLLENPQQQWVTHSLSEVLTQRGHRSLLYRLADNDSPVSVTDLQTTLHEQAAGCEICLLPTTAPATILDCQLDHVVLLVPANLDAILTAYQRIKLLSKDKEPDIGIVMVGPRDQHAAWRYFRKLAVGSLRYLDIPLLNLGFLPQQVLPEQGPSDHHRRNFLLRISERLLRSGFYSDYRAEHTETSEQA